MKTGSETEHDADPLRGQLLRLALPHVVFDGWTDRTLALAADEAGVDEGQTILLFPRGGVDLALAFHNENDLRLAGDLAGTDLSGLRFRDKVAFAVMHRFELVASHREEVRRATALFALPMYVPDGARAIWQTSDTIWTALGDTSTDYNWYTKRATLAAVFSSALLYWLGDETPDKSATRAFAGRRIDNVMQFEKTRAKLRKNPLAQAFLRGPTRILDRVKAPGDRIVSDMPGYNGPGN